MSSLPRRSILFAPAAALLSKAASDQQNRDAFLQMIDRPRVPLAAESRLVAEGRFERHAFSFVADSSQRVPGLLVKPKSATGGRLPVVVVLHGTGGTKEGQLPLLERLAGEGYLAIAIDGRYHGARTRAGKGSSEYVDAMLRTWRGEIREHPFLYDTVWDIMRLLDWLQTRPDVDSARIGMIGFSKGGMELYLAAAVDPRIRAAVPCIGVQSFAWAIDNNAWQSRVGTFQAAVEGVAKDMGKPGIDAAVLRQFYDRVAPGVYSKFDGPSMLPLIAPRPLLVINGDSDARTPRLGLQLCLDAAEQAYAKAGAGDKFRAILQPNTAHKVNADALDAAFAWFHQWLTPNNS